MDTHSASHEMRWIPTTLGGLATAATAKRDHVKQDRTKEDTISTDGVRMEICTDGVLSGHVSTKHMMQTNLGWPVFLT
jgi:hypothetical protein